MKKKKQKNNNNNNDNNDDDNHSSVQILTYLMYQCHNRKLHCISLKS